MTAATKGPSLAVLSFLAAGCCHGALIAQTTYGAVKGAKCPSSSSNYFSSIPYAEPPLGDLRLAPPLAFSGSFGVNGTLLATAPAKACVQFSLVDSGEFVESEDCLYLNIFAPSNATAESNLPIKVFVHGGGDTTGGIADSLINGCNASADALVVTVGYRLGPLGWLSSQPAGLSGNFGLQDQMLALKWVKENIAGFGGDPTKLVLFGQSAGAMNVFSVATLPQAPDLMSAVIMESGGGVGFPTIAGAAPWNQQFAKRLGCSFDSATCFRSKTKVEFVTAVRAMPADTAPTAWTLFEHMGWGATWGPVVDGQVIPTQPSEAGVKVPAIFGSNGKEGSIFVYSQYLARAFSLNQADWTNFLRVNFGNLSTTVDGAMSLSPQTGGGGAVRSVFDAMAGVITHSTFRCTALRAARAARAPAFVYLFNHTTTCDWVPGVPNTDAYRLAQGATHSAELPYVFGVTDGLPNGCSLDATEREISAFMIAAWTSMAASGQPGEASEWPAFSAEAPMGMVFGKSGQPTLGAMDVEGCEFWDRLVDEVSAASVLVGGGNVTGTGSNGTATNGTGGDDSSSGTSEAVRSFLFPRLVLILGWVWLFL